LYILLLAQQDPPSAEPLSPPISKLAPVITIGNTTITVNSKLKFIIGSQTLRLGGQVTYLSTTVSLAIDGKVLNVDGTTQHLESVVAGTGDSSALTGSDSGGGVENMSGSSSSLDQPSSEITAVTKKLHNVLREEWHVDIGYIGSYGSYYDCRHLLPPIKGET
jgi:hypothetical protein